MFPNTLLVLSMPKYSIDPGSEAPSRPSEVCANGRIARIPPISASGFHPLPRRSSPAPIVKQQPSVRAVLRRLRLARSAAYADPCGVRHSAVSLSLIVAHTFLAELFAFWYLRAISGGASRRSNSPRRPSAWPAVPRCHRQLSRCHTVTKSHPLLRAPEQYCVTPGQCKGTRVGALLRQISSHAPLFDRAD